MIVAKLSQEKAGRSRPAFFRLRRLAAVGLALLAPLVLVGCGEGPAGPPVRDTYVIEGSAFGTYYVIKLVEPKTGSLDSAQLEGLRLDLDKVLAEIDLQISSYRADSEVSRWNASPDGFAFSPASFEVLEAALAVAAKTGGAFDPTVGPLVEAWGFGPHGRSAGAGQDELVARARERVGFTKLAVDPTSRRVRAKVANMHLDLSAIGEGHAIDRLALFLAGRGFEDVLVELGGEARAHGRNAAGNKWRIGIERPSRERGEAVQRIVELDDAAVSTSGDYRKYREENGERLSHLIDPRQGRPIGHKLASVSVIAPTCRQADVWATALMVLGPEEGFAKAVAENLPALFLVRVGEDFVEKPTPAFAASYELQATESR